MKAEAIKLTSGSVSSAELRRLDHPYARRHGSPRLPRLPINRQTGRLRRSLRVFRSGADSWRLQFVAPQAKFVLAPGGTKFMLARNFWPEMRRRANRHVAKILKAKRMAEAN